MKFIEEISQGPDCSKDSECGDISLRFKIISSTSEKICYSFALINKYKRYV